MTSPALPGAAPDPARLPPEVESCIEFCRSMAIPQGHPCWDALRTAIRAALGKRGEVSAASAASARALGGDGEPVAWARGCKPVGNRASVEVVHSSDLKPDDVIWSEAWCVVGEAPKSEDGAFEAAEIIDDAGGIDRPQEFFEGHYLRVTPSHARPAATGDTGEVEKARAKPGMAPRVVVEPYGRSEWRVWLHIGSASWAVGDPRHTKDAAERFAEPLRHTLLAATGDHPSEARRGHESEGRGGPDAR